MDLQPWDYWDAEGRPTGNTAEVVSRLESVIARNADHAGALHLYVHAVEASNEPQRGVAAADRLRELIPGSGHLVHMPAHIYARVGRYHDAVIANQKAIASDDAYLARCRPQPGVYPLGYVPHNHHFLWFAATMEGASAVALEAAKATSARTSDPQLMRAPGFEAMQVFSLTPLFANVRFGRWQDVEAWPRPADDLPYMIAMWHYAQGMAAARQGKVEEAKRHHETVAAAARNPDIEKMKVWDRYSIIHGVRIAERVLAAELARAQKDYATAAVALRGAVAIEDSIPYDEPPGWHAPVRQTLGAVLLQGGKAAEAQAIFAEELRRNPENGWSLFGLEQSLRAQGRKQEAGAVAERFTRSWTNADVELSVATL
jgi:tetratricopeptide (TPR) repeat protein